MLHQKQEPKHCLACGEVIKGRSDKKFCNDYCRNNYNNQLKSSTNSQVRIINNVLAKNRRILERLLPPEKETTKANRDQLLLKGFSFMYITHTYTTKTGKTYSYCYDYGYLPTGNDWFLIVRRVDE